MQDRSDSREHWAAARREAEAMLKSLLPQAFWDHACASKREAKAAAGALRRALRRQLSKTPRRASRAKQKIEIA